MSGAKTLLQCFFILFFIITLNHLFFHILGDFVIVSPIEEGNKVKGEIVYVLYSKQIKYLKQENLW